MTQPNDISDQRLAKIILRAQGNRKHPVSEEDVDDLLSALIELKERRDYEEDAVFMSKPGDWFLAVVLMAIFGYGIWLVWGMYA